MQKLKAVKLLYTKVLLHVIMAIKILFILFQELCCIKVCLQIFGYHKCPNWPVLIHY